VGACVSAWRYENIVDIAQYKYRILLLFPLYLLTRLGLSFALSVLLSLEPDNPAMKPAKLSSSDVK
jgi:hypothetical protein